jgi:hypothetical protein
MTARNIVARPVAFVLAGEMAVASHAQMEWPTPR